MDTLWFIPWTIENLSGRDDLAARAEAVSAFFAFVAVLMAFGAVIGAFVQIYLAKKIQREALAIQAYDAYLKLCLDNPELANGHWKARVNRFSKKITKERYEWFVAIMLNACEQIMLTKRNDKEWIITIEYQAKYHIKYLKSRRGKKYYRCYSPQLVGIIRSVISEFGDSSAAKQMENTSRSSTRPGYAT